MVKQKNFNIDRLRVIASFGIICFHSQTGLLKLIGYVGLPVFVMITFGLGTINTNVTLVGPVRTVLKGFLSAKIHRLIIPYIAWVVIYWGWGWFRMITGHGEIIESQLTIFFPLYGTSIHLWYLPFVFTGLILFSTCKLYYPLSGFTALVIFLLLMMFTSIAPAVFFNQNKMPLPLPQILFALPPLFVGLIISDMTNVKGNIKYCLTFFFIIFTFFVHLLIKKEFDLNLLLLPIAFLLVVFCIKFPGKSGKIVKELSPLTFGIYLVHPIIVAIIKNILLFYKMTYLLPVSSLLIFLISAAVTYAFSLTKIKVII